MVLLYYRTAHADRLGKYNSSKIHASLEYIFDKELTKVIEIHVNGYKLT